jgi:hypothetical protein
LETRLLIAYTIIAAMLLVGSVALIGWKRRRDARRLRLRGIKTGERAAERTASERRIA